LLQFAETGVLIRVNLTFLLFVPFLFATAEQTAFSLVISIPILYLCWVAFFSD
jgi:hypothetical protein